MKTIYLIFISILFMNTACTKSNEENNISQQLLGTWKHTENYISDGNPAQWIVVEHDFTYTFLDNGNLLTNGELFCEGSYNLSETNVISMTMNCNEYHIFLIPGGDFNLAIINESILTLSNINCEEACVHKLVKISNN